MPPKSLSFLLLSSLFFMSCQSQQTPIANNKTSDSGYTYKMATMDGIGKFYKGREISHVMGAAGSDWLERDERNEEENTQLVIEKIQIPVDATIADIGAGTGYYAFKLAPKVPKGKVYAVEIQDEMIRLLNKKKRFVKDSVIKVIKGTVQSPNLPANSVDLAIMVDVYHELEFPQEMLLAIRKTLKPNGKILLIEYRGEDLTVPIKELHKTTVAQLNKEFEVNGFKLYYRGDFLPIQHYLLYEKVDG